MRLDDEIKPNKKVKDSKKKEEQYIVHNVIISDASGSMMGARYNASCDSIKNELDILKQDKNVIFKQSLIEFDSNRFNVHLWCQEDYNSESIKFIGAIGGTPLYNTIGKVIEDLQKQIKPNEKVLLKIFTDGGDTDIGRGKWNKNNLGILIKKLIDVDKWTITFNCTTFDVYRIKKLNIPDSNILTHNNTAKDIERIGNLRTTATVMYSKSLQKGEDVTVGFYSKSIS